MSIDERTRYYLARLDLDENAYFSLIEAPEDCLPGLVGAFRSETDLRKRTKILNIIWQHRSPSTISVLAEALNDPVDSIWKEALDGLLTIARPECIDVLESALNRSLHGTDSRPLFQHDVTEALTQLALTQLRPIADRPR
jgi:hypothetical protein